MKRLNTLAPLWAPFSRSNVTIYAAGASFYLALSLLPSALLICALLPYFPLSQSYWLELAGGAIPSSIRAIINYVLNIVYTRRSPALLSVSALAALWSASKGVLAIMDGLNAVLSFPLTRGYIRRRIQATLYFILLSCGLLLIMISLVFGEALLRTIVKCFPGVSEAVMILFRLREPTVFLLLTALFTMIYRFLPTNKLPIKYCLHSALLVSLSWILFSFAFSFYIYFISNSERLYGSIGLLLLSGIWLHLSIALVMYGGIYAGVKHKYGYSPVKIIRHWIAECK